MPTHIQSATQIKAAGNRPKIIEEHIGRINTGMTGVSIARMQSPAGWVEPGQTPDFDEYTLVLRGTLLVTFHGGAFDAHAGQSVIAPKGEWIQYSSPYAGGAESIAVCVPAFSPETVHRDATH